MLIYEILINPSNNKLLSIIDSFSKVELNRLTKFIKSPYFNSNKEVTSLYLLITKEFSSSLEFSKENLWNSVCGVKTFDSLKFRKLFSDLLKLIEQFLAQEVYDKKHLLKANYLLKSISERELSKLHSTSLSNAYRLGQKTAHKGSEYYFYQYQREKNIYDLKKSDLDRSSESNLKEIIDNLDYFYLAEKVRFLCELINRKDVISAEYEILFKDEIINHLNRYGYENVPIVSIYYLMYLTLKEENDDNYDNLKVKLRENIDILPKAEAKEIYTSVINYCIKKINKGDNKFLDEFLILNETLLENNIIADNEMSPWKFKNIITVGLRLSKFNWVENFIETYKDKISEKYRENAIIFNTAQLYFYQKDFSKLLPLLLQVDYEDFTYRINTRHFTVITYYELQEYEALSSFIDSFNIFLKRQNSITVFRKKHYYNFLYFTKKLLRFINFKKVDLHKLKIEIIERENTAAKEWLLEKIDQLLYPNASQRTGSDDDPFQKKLAQ